jgi:hypothetical protein
MANQDNGAASLSVFLIAILALLMVFLAFSSSQQQQPMPSNPVPSGLTPGRYVYDNQTCTRTKTLTNGTVQVAIGSHERISVYETTTVLPVSPFCIAFFGCSSQLVGPTTTTYYGTTQVMGVYVTVTTSTECDP